MRASFDVLCLVTDAYGGYGGIAQSCQDFVSALARFDGVGRIEILPRFGEAEPSELPHKVLQHRAVSAKALYAMAAIGVGRRNPGIVFCNHLYMAPVAAVVARMAGARFVIQLHGTEIWTPPTWVQRLALESADLALCVSRDTRARALTYSSLLPERAVVLNNTIRPTFEPRDRAAARARFGLGEEFALISVSRLDSREQKKGQDRVIAALSRLGAPAPNIIYLIAGDGDDRPRLEALARQAGIEDQVRFLGSVPACDLPDFYSAGDLFVLPSTSEGFGIAFIEAMACGTQALGLAVAGAVDALGDGELGWCVAAEEFPAALARAIVAPRVDPATVAAKVQARFGARVYQEQVARALTRYC